MLNTASELYNDLLGIYFDEYYELSDAKKIESKYDPDKLFLKAYNFDIWFENEETNDTIRKIKDLSDIMQENMIMIRDPKTFYFNFDWPIDVDENLNLS